MRRRRSVAAVAAVLVVAFGALSAGCFGSFQLTSQLYEVNKSVEDKYLRSAVTWLFIIPYAFAATLDFFIFNLVEFWSGRSSIASGPVTMEQADAGGKSVLLLARDGAATLATVERYEGETLVSTSASGTTGREGHGSRERGGQNGAGDHGRSRRGRLCGSHRVDIRRGDEGAVRADAVQAGMARVARIASVIRLAAASGPAWFIPLAAARVPAHRRGDPAGTGRGRRNAAGSGPGGRHPGAASLEVP